MTEGEYFETLTSLVSNGLAAYAIFISLVGAYLMVAYNAGGRLTSPQVWIVNILYLASVTFVLMTIYGTFGRMNMLSLELEELNPKRDALGIAYGPMVAIIVNLLVLIASLKFMADIRSKSNEGST